MLHTKLTERLAEDRQRRQELEASGEPLATDKKVSDDDVEGTEEDKLPATLVGLVSDSEFEVIEDYKISDLSVFYLDPTQFYDDAYSTSLAEMIRAVVNTEGPVHELLLLQRIARAHSFKRAGTKMLDRVNDLASAHCGVSEESTGRFWWPEGVNETHKERYARVNNRSEETAKPDWICDTELKNIIRSRGLDNDPSGLCRVLGIQRLTVNVKERFEGLLQEEDIS